MIRSSRSGTISRRVLIAVAAVLVPILAGCEAGLSAPSLQWHQPTDGTGKIVGGITISNAFVLGAPIGAALKPGQNAGLFLGLTNTGTSSDTLVSIRAVDPQSHIRVASSVQLPGGAVNLWRNRSVLLTGPRPAIVLQDLLRPLPSVKGSTVTLILVFRNAGQVTLQVPVLPRSRYFRTLLPAPEPVTVTPSPSASLGSRTPATVPSPSPSSSH